MPNLHVPIVATLALMFLGGESEVDDVSKVTTSEIKLRETLLALKSLPPAYKKKELYPKEFYEVQFSQDSFLQVERTFIENTYGSIKETQIYYVKDNQYHLLSRHELTESNIIPEIMVQYTKEDIAKIISVELQ